MATYDQNSTQEAEKLTTLKYNARDVSRMVNVAIIDVVLDATEVATDTVKLWTPSFGGVVHGYDILGDGIATTATVDLGVGATADNIADGIDVAAAGLDSGRSIVEFSQGDDVFLTYATLATPVAAKTLKIAIEYSKNT